METVLHPYALNHDEGEKCSFFGSLVFGPRETPHGFRAEGSAPARMLMVAAPAGFERFLLAVSEPAPAAGFLPDGALDMEKIMAEAAKADIDILGPLPK